MEIARWREQSEEILSFALWVFKVCDCCEIGKRYLFEKALFSCGLVERKEVWAKDEVESFPLLYKSYQYKEHLFLRCPIRSAYFGLPGTFMYLSTFEDSIEGETTVLVHWGKCVQVEMPTSHAGGRTGHCDRICWRDFCIPSLPIRSWLRAQRIL